MSRSTAQQSLHHEVWESLGQFDPDWAVLTSPDRRHGGWREHLDDFYATGRADIAEVLALLPPDASHERALDWGSGTGRLSFALLERFREVTAVDVSRSMLTRLAQRAAEIGAVDRVSAIPLADVRPAGDHDFAVSLLVLQHLGDPRAATAALRTMAACIKSGGHLVVEIPDRAETRMARLQPRFRIYRALRRVGLPPSWLHRHGLSGISMLTLEQPLVRQVLRTSDMRVLACLEHSDGAHRYVRYVAQRRR